MLVNIPGLFANLTPEKALRRLLMFDNIVFVEQRGLLNSQRLIAFSQAFLLSFAPAALVELSPSVR
ncbi:hypothetical protein Plhal304r1_c010g0039951 [Plasmopara halstedii]